MSQQDEAAPAMTPSDPRPIEQALIEALTEQAQLVEALASQDFYELMQAYRHMPLTDANGIANAFEAVAVFVLDAARRAGAGQDWQPIASAPKDGTWILLGWFELPGMSGRDVGFWHSTHRAWCDVHHVLHKQTSFPTHWQPLPTPPRPESPEL